MGLFAGQVAWITGAGRGIGRAAALMLAEQGATVALVSRTQHELDEAVAEVRARGGKAISSLLDVSNWDMVAWTAHQIEEALGPIDLLVNNAGVLEPLGKLWETDPEQWARAIDINLTGAYHCLRAVLPGMVRRNHGHIVNISSGAATRTSPGWSAYAASKAGLDHLTRSLAIDLQDADVHVYTLHPGIVETQMVEALRSATPDQLPPARRQFFVDQTEAGNVLDPIVPARAIAWLCSPWCDLKNGVMIDLRDQPELLETIDRALGK